MLHHYPDIRKRISDPPSWYDHHGVPRYDPHHPGLCPDIYADEVVLLRIACQSCGQEFDVQMSRNSFLLHLKDWTTLTDEVLAGSIHAGDPPRHPCDGGGDTMNCEDLAVLEFWKRDERRDWVRVAELELLLKAEHGCT